MPLEYADPENAARRRIFSGPVAIFTASWLAAVVLPPIFWVPFVAMTYRDFKLELPTATRTVVSLHHLTTSYGWALLIIPVLAGFAAAKVFPEPTDAIERLHRRQIWLYIGLIITLLTFTWCVLQMIVLWLPWMSITWSISGGSAATGNAPAGP